MDSPLVSCIVITRDRPNELQECLQSIFSSAYGHDHVQVLVVDNGRGHQAAAVVERAGVPAKVIETGRNLLTSAACNIGANAAEGEFLFFMADDNHLDTKAIQCLVDAAMSSGADVLAPVCYFKNDTKRVASAGVSISLWTGISRRPHAGHFDLSATELDWKPEIIDNAMFIRRSTFFMLRGFDVSNFPMHNEEADFCIRALKRGVQIATVPDAIIWHGVWPKRGRFGFGNRDFCLDSPLRAYLTGRNRNMLVRRHGSFVQKMVFFGCFFVPFTAAYLAIILSHRNLRANRTSYIRGVRDSFSAKLIDIADPSSSNDPQTLSAGDESWAWIYDAV
jgi:GT2 family glycosyltransferase